MYKASGYEIITTDYVFIRHSLQVIIYTLLLILILGLITCFKQTFIIWDKFI